MGREIYLSDRKIARRNYGQHRELNGGFSPPGNPAGFWYNEPMEMMEKCRFHPDREACVRCQKMEFGYCQECLDDCRACTDPCLYCKFRRECVIWELCRKEARKRCKENEGKKAKRARGEKG